MNLATLDKMAPGGGGGEGRRGEESEGEEEGGGREGKRRGYDGLLVLFNPRAMQQALFSYI